MSCSTKQKILDEGQMFSDEWFLKYVVVQQNEKTLCLIYSKNITCLKEFQYHAAQPVQTFRTIQGNLGHLRVDKAHQLKSLQGQQKMIYIHQNDI